ncbi:MAG: nucleotide exchange factor GrpE [Gammaproteobacteria bacterium]|nr:nucleotide exchange factor GrpE [Gammaproteobacteria bacterium]
MSEDQKRTESDQPLDDEVSDPPGAPRHETGGANDPAAGVAAESDSAEAAEGMPGDGGADQQSPAAQLEAVRAELAEQKDRYLRAAAEADNVRRRADNDIANARKYAIEGFAAEILSVRDSLEIARSLEINEDDAGAVAKMKEGLDLTLKQLDSALSKFAVEVVDPQKGDKLDPERHQAMTTQESENVPPNHILNVLQKGYTIHDRLLRPAMVVVARKPEGETQAEGETA